MHKIDSLTRKSKGSIVINGYKMEWTIELCTYSNFFRKKERTENVKIYKDGILTMETVKGINKKSPDKADDETYICYSYAVKKAKLK